MTGFSGPLRVQFRDDGETMIVLEAITFTDGAGRVWPLPAGAISDGASIPRALWSTVGSPFTGLYRVAAFFHDEAYRTPGMDKEAADLMLRECAIACGCSVELADLIYAGVRIGGEWSFEADQREVAAA